PGDIVKGVIENGVPVIYINDTKLDEPYVNKYPLLARYLENPVQLREQALRQAFAFIQYTGMDRSIEEVADDLLFHQIDWRSYDTYAPYDKQPFYRFSADRVAHVSHDTGLVEQGIAVT